MTIVVAYDGSRAARRAVAVAGRLFEGRAIVAHVVSASPPPDRPEPSPGPAPGFPTGGTGMTPSLSAATPDVEAALADQARSTVDEGCALAREAGLEAEPALVADSSRPIWEELVALADERDADALVVGRRDLGRLKEAVAGSVSTAVVRHATRPVLVVPDPAGSG